MKQDKELIAAEIRLIESRIELNKAHAELLRAQTQAVSYGGGGGESVQPAPPAATRAVERADS